MAQGADDQHQACRRQAQGVNLSSTVGRQQRIDAQRPVQHQVVDQGSAEQREDDFGHECVGDKGPVTRLGIIRHAGGVGQI
ncbi:hypothetical protein D9M68_993200 [compost metagenome]